MSECVILVSSLEPELTFASFQNVAGRTLVGLRYWNEVDEEGESSWVFECRDVSRDPLGHEYDSPHSRTALQPSRPANPIDEKYVQMAAMPMHD